MTWPQHEPLNLMMNFFKLTFLYNYFLIVTQILHTSGVGRNITRLTPMLHRNLLTEKVIFIILNGIEILQQKVFLEKCLTIELMKSLLKAWSLFHSKNRSNLYVRMRYVHFSLNKFNHFTITITFYF